MLLVPLLLAPLLLGADERPDLRAWLLPPLDATTRAELLAGAARELGVQDLRWVADAVRVRDELPS